MHNTIGHWRDPQPRLRPMLAPAYLLNDAGPSLSRDSEERLTRWGSAGQEGGWLIRAFVGAGLCWLCASC